MERERENLHNCIQIITISAVGEGTDRQERARNETKHYGRN